MAERVEGEVILKLNGYAARFLRLNRKMAESITSPRSDMLPFLLEELYSHKEAAFEFLDENDVLLPDSLVSKYRTFLDEVIQNAKRLEKMYYKPKINRNTIKLAKMRLEKLKAKFEIIRSGFRQILKIS